MCLFLAGAGSVMAEHSLVLISDLSRNNACLSGQGAVSVPRNVRLDEMAIARLEELNPFSIAIDREFGGSICQDGAGRLFAAAPAMGRYAGRVTPNPCPPGSNLKGRFHTHGAFGQEEPSGDDLENARVPALAGVVFYVATPKGCVYSWQGPDPQAVPIKRCN